MNKIVGLLTLMAFMAITIVFAGAFEEPCMSEGSANQNTCTPLKRTHVKRCNDDFMDDFYFNPRYPLDVWTAAKLGNDWMVDWNIAQKPELLNQADNRGWTPLHHAAWGGHKSTVELLLTAGADSSIKTRDGKTALDIAKRRGFCWTADLLKKK